MAKVKFVLKQTDRPKGRYPRIPFRGHNIITQSMRNQLLKHIRKFFFFFFFFFLEFCSFIPYLYTANNKFSINSQYRKFFISRRSDIMFCRRHVIKVVRCAQKLGLVLVM